MPNIHISILIGHWTQAVPGDDSILELGDLFPAEEKPQEGLS